MKKKTPRRMRQARRAQPTPIPVLAPFESPVVPVGAGAELVGACVLCVVVGVDDVCEKVLLLLVVALEADEVEVDDGNSEKPGLVTVVISFGFVRFSP